MSHPFTRLLDYPGEGRMPLVVVALAIVAALPLWIAAVVLLAPIEGIDRPWLVSAALAWAALLVAFAAGIRAGVALGPIGAARRGREFLAAAGFVFIAAAVFFAPPVVGFSLALASVLMQALWDVTAGDEGRVPGWWARARLIAAALLVFPLLGLLVRVSLAGP
jgi:hypothetical protein